MLQDQLDRMQSRQVPVRNQVVPETPRPSLDRRNSYSDNIRTRLVNKAKTPTFGELQYKFSGSRHSPSPLSDRDYQKEARQTVVGELSGFGNNFQASRISGRRRPSQSPSMRLLGMLHIHDDPDGESSHLNHSLISIFQMKRQHDQLNQSIRTHLSLRL